MFWPDDDDDDFCYKRVQTPGMSPPRAGAWTYCLFTLGFGLECSFKPYLTV